jgi:hypothetical protein
VTVTNSNGCETTSAAFVVTENALPIVTCPSSFTVCISDPALLLNGGDPTGGNYSGTGVTGGNTFDPAIAGAGPHIITYIYTNANGCESSCSFTITVDNTGVPTITGNNSLCIGGTTNLTGLPAGGVWTSSNNAVATVNPSGIVTGISYGYADITYSISGAGCSGSYTYSVYVEIVTVTGTVPGITSACYPNLRTAFESINNRIHQGVVQVLINDDTDETATAVLNASGAGLGNYSSVTIFPTVAGLSVLGNVDGPMVLLNGADNVRFYGYPSDPPPPVAASSNYVYPLSHVADLSIKNFSVTENASTIKLEFGANSNYIEMCKISGSGTNPALGVITVGEVITSNNVTIGYNEITGNDATRPTNAIYSGAPNTATNSALNNGAIRNNNIFNFLNPEIESCGVFLFNGSSYWTIEANSFYETMPFTSTIDVSYKIIQISSKINNAQNFIVRGNFIGGNAPNAPIESYWVKNGNNNSFIGIYMDIGENFGGTISSNTIRSFKWTNSEVASWTGIHHQSGRVVIGGNEASDGNVIGLSTLTGKNSIIISNGSNSTLPYGRDGISGIRSMSSSVTKRRIGNNIIAAIATDTDSDVTYQFHGIYTGRSYGNGQYGAFNIFNNRIGNDEPHSISIGKPGGFSANNARGIVNSGDGSIDITSNVVQNISAFGVGADPGYAESDVIGIRFVGAGGGNTKIADRNYIHKLFVESPSYGSSVSGFSVDEGNLTVVNNVIRLGKEVTSRSSVDGIYRGGAGGGSQTIWIHFNTIVIEGEVIIGGGAPASSNCILLDRSFTSQVTARVFNNILYNSRTRVDQYQTFPTNIALHINSSLYGWVTSDYNDMFVSGDHSALVAIGPTPPGVGLLTFNTLNDWRIYSNRDLNSLNLNPNFANPTGSLPEDFKPDAEVYGRSGVSGTLIVNDDFLFDDIRPITPNPLPPTIGAWEMCKVIIIQQPVNDGGCDGEDAQFTVEAIGSGTLTYQWQISTDGGTNWINVNEAAPYSGVTTAMLNITGITAAMNGYQYRCLVTSTVTQSSCVKTKESEVVALSIGSPPTTSLIWHQ